MSIAGLIVLLLVVGVVLTLLPFDAQIKKLIFVVCVIAVIFVLLNLTGVRFW